MEINPLLSRLMKDKKEDVIHSSGYAKVQNGGGIGSASVESFKERRKIDANRNFVQRYGDSQVGRGVKMEPAKKVIPEKPAQNNPPVRRNPGI